MNGVCFHGLSMEGNPTARAGIFGVGSKVYPPEDTLLPCALSPPILLACPPPPRAGANPIAEAGSTATDGWRAAFFVSRPSHAITHASFRTLRWAGLVNGKRHTFLLPAKLVCEKKGRYRPHWESYF